MTINRLNIALFIITLTLNLLINFDPPVWKGYSDPYDYLYQSKEPLTSKELYSPTKKNNFSPRPFTVPLIYKIANSNPQSIMNLQKIVHSLAAFFLCYVILLFIKRTAVKVIFMILWYFLMSWWNIMGWTNTLLSESLSISFMFLWISSFLLLIHKKNTATLVFHFIITVLFSFTRDNWPYVLIIFYFLSIVAVIKFKNEKKLIVSIAILLISAFFIFFIQDRTARIGQRYRLPIMNNIVFRVLPNDHYLNWFSKKGMPCIPELKRKYYPLSDWKMIYPLYSDSTLTKFSDWVIKDGKSTYMKFLLSHPENIFLVNEKPEDLKKIFSYNIGYTGDVTGYSLGSQHIFPLFNAIAIIILNFFILFLFVKEKRFVFIVPTILIVVFTMNAVLLYIADALEIERHSIFTNIIIQFLGILLVTFIIDSDFMIKKLSELWMKAGLIKTKFKQHIHSA